MIEIDAERVGVGLESGFPDISAGTFLFPAFSVPITLTRRGEKLFVSAANPEDMDRLTALIGLGLKPELSLAVEGLLGDDDG